MRFIDVLSAFRRRWPVILACLLLCAGAAGVYSKLATKVFRASTEISVTAARFDYGNGLAAQEQLANYAELMTGEDLLGRLNQQLQLDMSPAVLGKMIKVSSDNTKLTISVDVDDTVPQRAADIANGLTDLFKTTQDQYNQAHLNPDVDVRIVHRAATPSSPNRPKTKVNTAAGALLGLLLGCAFAYALDVWDDRLRTERDVETGLGLPLLGSVPHFRGQGAPALPPPAGGSGNGRAIEPTIAGRRRS